MTTVSGSIDIDDLVRLRVRRHGAHEGTAISSDNASFLLELSRPAAAVLAFILRSTPASKAAGLLVLAHLGVFRTGDVGKYPLAQKFSLFVNVSE